MNGCRMLTYMMGAFAPICVLMAGCSSDDRTIGGEPATHHPAGSVERGSTHGSAPTQAAKGEPRSLWEPILAPYKKGDVESGRKALIEHLKVAADYSATIAQKKPKNAFELEGILSIAGSASGVRFCLDQETRLGTTATIPSEIYQLGDDLLRGIDRAVALAVAMPDLWNERTQGFVDYAHKEKGALLKKEILVLARAGDSERAKAVYDSHHEFLQKRGLMRYEEIVAEAEQAEAMRSITITGEALPLCKVILDYYHALAAEDAQGLDGVLLHGPGLMNGQQLVEALEAERKAERDFDSLGPIDFDMDTTLHATRQQDGDYLVVVSNLRKHFIVDGQDRTVREADRFVVRRTSDGYRILKKETRR